MEAPSSNTPFKQHPSRDFPESVPAIDIVDLVAYAVSKIG
jgi:hypothetical protein